MSNRRRCTKAVGTSWSVTSVLALILSWMLNHSVGWCIVHFFLGWAYLLWAMLVRTNEVKMILGRLFG